MTIMVNSCESVDLMGDNLLREKKLNEFHTIASFKGASS